MPVSRELVYGTLLESNIPIPPERSAVIKIKGLFQNKETCFDITADMLSRHTLLLGGTGSGKTNLFYHFVQQIKSKMTSRDVMLVFDSKGDFYDRFFTYGDILIGNSEKYRKISEKWSIYEEICADGKKSHSIALNIQEISKALFSERTERNNNNPFFPNAARDLFASIMIALIRDGVNFCNKDLKNYLDSASADSLRELLSKHRDLSSVTSYIDSKSGSQAQGVLSEMYSTTRDILIGVFADTGSFSMRNFIRKKGGRTAFLEYDLSIGDVLSPVYSLLFDLALKETLGREASEGNVYLVADELKLLPNLRHLEDGINFGRGLGLKIMAGLQSIDQLNANYSNESRAKNIVSGFSSVYAFRSNDFSTREYVSKLFGRNMMFERYPMPDGRFHCERREGYTVEDWDLTGLHIGEAIVGLPYKSPFPFQFSLFDS